MAQVAAKQIKKSLLKLSAHIEGNLIDLIYSARKFIDKYIYHEYQIGKLKANKEIKSGVSKLRNRVIGRVFEEVGLIEQWGSGIQRIISSCAESGLREPVFEEIGTHFRVTLYSEAVKGIDLDKKDKEIIRFLRKAKAVGASTNQIAENISLTSRATRTRLIKLSDKGIVAEIGNNPSDPQKKYILITCKKLDLI